MKNITVICEGHTESNYISALNDYLWTVSQNLNIDHRNLKGINRNNYISEIKKISKYIICTKYLYLYFLG